jgi:hypothetical protein
MEIMIEIILTIESIVCRGGSGILRMHNRPYENEHGALASNLERIEE